MIEEVEAGDNEEMKKEFTGNLDLVDHAANRELQLVEDVVSAQPATRTPAQLVNVPGNGSVTEPGRGILSIFNGEGSSAFIFPQFEKENNQ